MFEFDVAEYKERIKKTKESMSRENIEVLLVSDPANMNYLTGYDGWSFYVPQLLILAVDEEEPIWVGRTEDSRGAEITTWLKEENIKPYGEDYIMSSVKHPMSFVAGILREKGLADRAIGVEMDAYYFTAHCLIELKKSLPSTALTDASSLVNWVRVVKSEKEIGCMKKAARVLEKVMQVAIDSIEVGVRQCDAAANIYHAQISGTPEYGGGYVAVIPLLLAGERSKAPHLTWTNEKFKENEVVVLELAGCYNHYHCPLCRTVYLGDPPSELKGLAEKGAIGFDRILEFMKPGLTIEEVKESWEKGIAGNDFAKGHRMGYSIGIAYPPDWGEHTVSIRLGDKTVLEPNMTFHMPAAAWLEDFGIEISESVRITENGCEALASFPRKLFVK